MEPYAFVALAPLIGLALNFLGHSLASIATGGRVQLSVLIGLLTGLVGMVAATAYGLVGMQAEPLDMAAYAALNAGAYFALFFCYFNFVNLNMTSLRIRVLLELLDTPGGLSQADLLGLYNSKELVARRIARLTTQGHLCEQDGRFLCKGKVLVWLVHIITTLKWMVLGHGNKTLQEALDRDRMQQERR